MELVVADEAETAGSADSTCCLPLRAGHKILDRHLRCVPENCLDASDDGETKAKAFTANRNTTNSFVTEAFILVVEVLLLDCCLR